MSNKTKPRLVNRVGFLLRPIYEVIKTNLDSVLDPESKHLLNLNIIITTFEAGCI